MLYSLVLSVGVALAATALGGAVASARGGGPGMSGRLSAPLVLCWVLPPVAIGYGLTPLAARLARHESLLLLIYSIVVTCRLAALAGLAFICLPPPVPPEGQQSFRLALRGEGPLPRFIRTAVFAFRGGGMRVASVFLLVFILAFGEFDLASMMNVRRWTVAAFDVSSQGAPAVEVLRVYLWPCLVQLGVVVVFLAISACFLSRKRGESLSLDEPGNLGGRSGKLAGILSVVSAWGIFLVVAGYPLAVIAGGAAKGMSSVLQSPWMLKESAASFVFAAAASACAWFAAVVAAKLPMPTRAALAFPGLLGALPLGMSVMALFQTSPLASFRDTPIPLLTALACLLTPYAMAVVFLSESFADGESLHSAELAERLDGGSRLLLRWMLKWRGMAVMMALVFVIAYFELTVSAILAPLATPTLSVRLFNLAHYGENERLSATLLLASLPPLAVIALVAVPWRWGKRRKTMRGKDR